MHKIKEKLMNALYEYEDKAKKAVDSKISAGELQEIHMLTDTIKNIGKIEMLEDGGGYSEESNWMGEGRMYGTSYDEGSSYARGRGRNARRDSMGRYSRDDGMSYDGGSSYARGGNMGGRGGYSREGAKEHLMQKAEEMLEMAHEPKERRAIEKFMRELDD